MAEPAHCYLCFDVLACELSKPRRSPHSLSELQAALKRKTLREHQTNGTSNGISNGTTNGTNGHTVSELVEAAPLFVTWNIEKNGGKQLRGCIGTFEEQPLEKGLESYALTAALEDTRFDPIPLKSLPLLECGVSILTNFEPASNAMDWDLGTHGLRISFSYHGRRMGATYLPDVAPEQGWTKEETLQSLMRKAGWSGRKHEWQKVELSVVRYQSTRSAVEYGEYKTLMEFMEGEKR